MRIVLSRKGFDSGNGGIPSPIMPDGTLLSFPIPSENGNTTYHDIIYRGKSYYEIMRELSPATAKKLENSKCHVDPDLLYRYKKEVADWKPAFGQSKESQIHLENHEISVGDMFLFYGWFRQTGYDSSGKLHFVSPKNDYTPDRHIIFGYMEIGEVIKEQVIIDSEYKWHPHALKNEPNNVLYVPKEKCSLGDNKKGYELLKYTPIRQLTKEGYKRSEWNLPPCLYNAEITFHEKDKSDSYGWKNNYEYFQSARIGQEFIILQDVKGELKSWLLDVIS